MAKRGPKPRPLAERIEDRSEVEADTKCWIWHGAITVAGYGQIRHERRTKYAHRCAYEAFIGPVPSGHDVCHSCGQRACVNPAHLYLFATYRGSVRERFEARYEIDQESGCWLWTGTCNPAGYGTIGKDRRERLAHRVSWELHRGPIPDGLSVCHHCDVPRSVNPDHLFVGTDADNMADKTRKMRQHWGEKKPTSKLTEGQVRAIR